MIVHHYPEAARVFGGRGSVNAMSESERDDDGTQRLPRGRDNTGDGEGGNERRRKKERIVGSSLSTPRDSS